MTQAYTPGKGSRSLGFTGEWLQVIQASLQSCVETGIVDSPSLEMFKAGLGGALSTLG